MPKTQSTMSEESVLLKKLTNDGKSLDDDQCKEIACDSSDTMVEALINILVDEELSTIDSPGEGIIPINAVKILRRLKPAAAIEPMLKTLAGSKYSDMIYSDLIFALQEFGAPVLEPGLKAFDDYVASDKDAQAGVAEILSGIGVKDQRIYTILLEMLEYDPVMAASLLTKYGDPAALPHLSDTLDTTNANNKTQITELVDAIRALGGTLTKRQQKLWDRKVASDRAAGTRKSGAPTIFRLGKPGAGLRL